MPDKAYTHLLFDLDHTLWDFDRNASEVLTDMFAEFKMAAYGVASAQHFIDQFHLVNYRLWDQYNRGEIGKDTIRAERFKRVLANLGVDYREFSTDFGEYFLAHCPRKPHVLPYTIEVLDYLQGRYEMHILTNGFDTVQAIKMASAGIDGYFGEVVTSERSGHRKPSVEMFAFILDVTGAPKETSLMIGDNLETDILGARNAAIDQVYFNPNKASHQEAVTYEINSLKELMGFL